MVSDRLRSITIVQWYAPTETSDIVEGDVFYEQFHAVQGKLPEGYKYTYIHTRSNNIFFGQLIGSSAMVTTTHTVSNSPENIDKRWVTQVLRRLSTTSRRFVEQKILLIAASDGGRGALQL